MHFTLKQLRYFVAAAEVGSITVASRRVHISQPAISAAIVQLETMLNVPLFIRHHASGLSLTPEGQSFLREARSLLTHAHDLELSATGLSGQIVGSVEVGCMTTLYPFVVPALRRRFKEKYPQADLKFVAGHHAELVEKLRGGDIVAILCYDMELPRDVAFEPLSSLPPYIFVAERHPLAHRDAIHLNEIIKEPFLLLDLPSSRDYFMSVFGENGCRPTRIAPFPSMDIIRSLVAHGEGYSLANARPRNKASYDGSLLSYVAIKDPVPALTYGTAQILNARASPRTSAFIQFCRHLLKDQPLPGSE
ncbi:LysR family transcriptional regulator [Acetobacter sp.]|jgi:DNA-binding transcriptional LysR family regulator|uniref:LysR family transcriptional regulator n=1 Tax=Acetobacter sp. TaxID=440 RepID=UPI0025C227E9|nr:LysR family transcriptional regulator [Acetobacter sp.]MCH4090765.1 LysR family transcriptional regulator [Acetobacter sp.]MCI1300519.1 LysR family transcriptional regulator [Acetobacter sp.]MCI1316279.1 LysR family transcriptional regulator [Acetobacter sp.]